MYSMFGNGHVYEYHEAGRLDYNTLTQKEVYPVIARRVGEMHRCTTCR